MPRPSRTCKKDGLVVTWGGLAPRSESLNQILESIIYVHDVSKRILNQIGGKKKKLTLQLVLSFPKKLCGLIKLL